MDAVVAGEYDVRAQHVVRVGERLDAPHHVGGFLAPFVADERRHVQAGAVLGLERAVVLVDDELDKLGHEGGVPVSVSGVGELRGEDEMQVAVGGVAGHAAYGNLHFILTPKLADPADRDRYAAFMSELVELVIDKYDGSLKAEHGTGLNMAPFVSHEWGEKATDMMWRIKALADPHNVLGPNIVLTRDDGIHLKAFKSTPAIEDVAT